MKDPTTELLERFRQRFSRPWSDIKDVEAFIVENTLPKKEVARAIEKCRKGEVFDKNDPAWGYRNYHNQALTDLKKALNLTDE